MRPTRVLSPEDGSVMRSAVSGHSALEFDRSIRLLLALVFHHPAKCCHHQLSSVGTYEQGRPPRRVVLGSGTDRIKKWSILITYIRHTAIFRATSRSLVCRCSRERLLAEGGQPTGGQHANVTKLL
jgi:hypothetical protein